MRALSWLVDVIETGILIVLASVPLVTAGAALSAGYMTMLKIKKSEGHILKNFLHAFVENWKRATLIWIIIAPLGAALGLSLAMKPRTPMLVLTLVFLLPWMIEWCWCFSLQARFDNSVGITMRNALVFGVSHFGATFTIVLCDAVYAYVMWFSARYFLQGMFLLILLAPGILAWMNMALIESAMKEFTSKDTGED